MDMDNTTADHFPEMLAWIKQEISATKTISVDVVVDYTIRYEPNPIYGVSEGTFEEEVGDQIIKRDPVYGKGEEIVLDEERAARAAEKLTELVLADESRIALARSLMPGYGVFLPYWETIHDRARDERTRKIAARKLGLVPPAKIWVLLERLVPAVVWLVNVMGWLGKAGFAILFYAGLICLFWPESRLGRWLLEKGGELWKVLVLHYLPG